MSAPDFGLPLDRLSPEQYRIRYEHFQAAARARAAVAVAAGVANIAEERVILCEIIPGGWYQSFRLKRGEALRIVNESGRSQVAAQIWNARDTSERYNAGDTIKLQWTALLNTGKLLYSDMGRVLVSIIGDSTDGRHDTISGVSNPATNLARHGDASLRNGRDNFRLAAAKLGLAKRDVHPAISFFARTRVLDDGSLGWAEGGKPGDFIDLRAELDLIITLSNTPHPLAPGAYDPAPVTATIWRPPAEEFCEQNSEEAARGFDNNRAYLRALHD